MSINAIDKIRNRLKSLAKRFSQSLTPGLKVDAFKRAAHSKNRRKHPKTKLKARHTQKLNQRLLNNAVIAILGTASALGIYSLINSHISAHTLIISLGALSIILPAIAIIITALYAYSKESVALSQLHNEIIIEKTISLRLRCPGRKEIIHFHANQENFQKIRSILSKIS